MVGMRQQFVKTMADLMKLDEQLVVLLCDIGVHGFRQAFSDHPNRIYNIGILEQSTIGVASGLGISGFIPVVHTIAPFLVERCYEQLKIDFGYQQINGNFVSVGASYDYASLGCTHHCPGDIEILKNIPNMSIIVPGTASEFDSLFKEAYTHKNPTYYRLSETSNNTNQDVKFGKAKTIKRGSKATVIAVGPMLQIVLEAVSDLDVTVLYYTTIHPFDGETLKSVIDLQTKIIVCEPYYQGGLTLDIIESLKPSAISIQHIGVPRKFLLNYGTLEEHNNALGLNTDSIRKKVIDFIN